jgi:hypothetical protein
MDVWKLFWFPGAHGTVQNSQFRGASVYGHSWKLLFMSASQALHIIDTVAFQFSIEKWTPGGRERGYHVVRYTRMFHHENTAIYVMQ